MTSSTNNWVLIKIIKLVSQWDWWKSQFQDDSAYDTPEIQAPLEKNEKTFVL